jgi:hypothetical protein
VALTNSEDREYAEKIVREVLSRNGETIKYKEMDIPLSLYVTSYQVESDNLKYADLFSQMQTVLDRIKFE